VEALLRIGDTLAADIDKSLQVACWHKVRHIRTPTPGIDGSKFSLRCGRCPKFNGLSTLACRYPGGRFGGWFRKASTRANHFCQAGQQLLKRRAKELVAFQRTGSGLPSPDANGDKRDCDMRPAQQTPSSDDARPLRKTVW
jgi:hypothetical protein